MPPRVTDPLLIQTSGADQVLRLNPAFVEHFGYDESAFAGAEISDRIHPDDQHEFQRVLAAGGEAIARLAHADGAWSPMNWSVRLDEGAATAVLGRLARPAPPRRRSGSTDLAGPGMQQTLDAVARIAEAKNPGMKCSILLVDKAGEYVTGGAGPSLSCDYNKEVEGLRIGPTVGSCGTAVFWNVPIVVEDIATDPLWRHLRGAAELAGVAACWSHPVTTTDGAVLGAMALYADEPAKPTASQLDGLEIAARMVGLAIEREALEERLRQAAKMEALGVLAGGVAHDFNNLLTAILGNAEIAQSAAGAAEAHGAMEEIIKASLAAAGLCDRMLAFAGRGVASKSTVDFNELAREVCKLMGAAISKKVSLDLELTEQSCCLDGDRGQIFQVVMNLLTNASEAIGVGRGRVIVTTNREFLSRRDLESRYPGTELESGEYVSLRVRDTGAGMADATKSRMFDPFFTTKESGRGLGLAAVRGIVQNHAGEISVASTPGHGTVVSVVFPLAGSSEEARDGLAAEARIPSLRILVVDDEPAVREVMVRHLTQAGHGVVVAVDGDEALELFEREGPFDCVLLDYSLPTLDGAEVFSRLRERQHDVRVVLMSGFTQQATMDQFEGEPLAGFIHKPVRAKALLSKIAEIVDHPGASKESARESS